MAQVVDCLPGKCKSLNSNFSTTRKKKFYFYFSLYKGAFTYHQHNPCLIYNSVVFSKFM
jgi:hypothetical protein